jgi:hypothetical protein
MNLFSIPRPPLIYEIFFKFLMSIHISNFMVNLKEFLDVVNTPTRIHHPSHEVIVMIKILVTLILDDHIMQYHTCSMILQSVFRPKINLNYEQ